MSDLQICPHCGIVLPAGAPGGLCPKCLLQMALAAEAVQALHLRCPHCRHAIEIVQDAKLTEITCPSCDSRISLVGEATVQYGEALPAKVGRFELVEQIGVG